MSRDSCLSEGCVALFGRKDAGLHRGSVDRRVLLGISGNRRAGPGGGCDRCLGGDNPLTGELGQSGFRNAGRGGFRALLGRWGMG